MTDAIWIEIPGEPVPKARAVVTRQKGRTWGYTPEKVKNYETRAQAAALNARNLRPVLEGPVRVLVEVYLSTPKSMSAVRQGKAYAGELKHAVRPDLDNFVKMALDVCNKIIFKDDGQVWSLEARKLYSQEPRMVIRVSPAP